MIIKNKPFERQHIEKKRDTFTVSLNDDERKLLEECKHILEQSKDSTALKMLAWYGAKALQSQETKYLLEMIYANKRKNKRVGIVDFE